MSSNSDSSLFKTDWEFEPMGDQPAAIKKLVEGVENGISEQVLLGVTGSGKTFTIANVIKKVQRPTLVLAHNKTLAAQLFQEFKDLFPHNAVEYFISYYDYYQPEAYVPSTDTFIAKVSTINEDIDKMRHSATRALLERRDVIIVSSVSCIYGLGSPEAYLKAMVRIEVGQEIGRDELLRALIAIRYERNDISLERGKFRVRGDTIELVPSHEKDRALRIQFFGRKIDKLTMVDALRGHTLFPVQKMAVYPGSHHVTTRDEIENLVENVTRDLHLQLQYFRKEGKDVEAQRLEQRVMYDIDMFREVGYCQGIENYSRYLDGRDPGLPPGTLLDYFPKDFLLVVDESHVTLPQIGGMYRGDRSRKETLVNFGFRLPAALDNRPLNFDEFKERQGSTIYVSATPAAYEMERSGTDVVEQLIRPTGLIDPEITIKPAKHQVDDLHGEILATVKSGGRVLVTTLTKKMSEELTRYLGELKIRVRYLHSDIDSIERVELLRDLRLGVYDVLIGINLLREGLDLPEVKLVAILDADKEGFLRSRTSLIQTVGRAARNSEGRVIFYADRITGSMQQCLDETSRRRTVQREYNAKHNITPQTILKKIPQQLLKIYNLDFHDSEELLQDSVEHLVKDAKVLASPAKLEKEIAKITKQMHKHAGAMEFEKAAELRDNAQKLRMHLAKILKPEVDAVAQ